MTLMGEGEGGLGVGVECFGLSVARSGLAIAIPHTPCKLEVLG